MIRDSKDHTQELVGKVFLTCLVEQQQHAFTALTVYCPHFFRSVGSRAQI